MKLKSKMKRKFRKHYALFALLGCFLIAGVFSLVPAARASDSGTVRAAMASAPAQSVYQDPTTFISSEFKADFPFNGIGASWDGQIPDNVTISVRFLTGGSWSGWRDMEPLRDMPDGWSEKGEQHTEPFFVDLSASWQYKLTAGGGILPTLRHLTFNYFDSSSKQTSTLQIAGVVRSLVAAAHAVGGTDVQIVSRAQWGADESWRSQNGTLVWPLEYAQPQKIIVHHTAGSDGGADPAATVRGIYYYHAVVLGWGDIGYNYLIDKNGTIYEGRAGGDGVVGGHTYNELKKVGYNRGSIGISVLGDYETNTPSAQAIESLTKLIANLGVKFGIAPSGQSYFVDQTMNNVVAHRDVDNTLCPGANLYSQLPAIRTDAEARFEAVGGGQISGTVAMKYAGQSAQPLSIHYGSEQDIWVEFQNTGTAVWRSYGPTQLTVAAQQTDSSFHASTWTSPQIAGTLATPNVNPGEAGRFIFKVRAPADQAEVTENFAIQSAGTPVEGTSFAVQAQITGLPYAALLLKQNVLAATFIQSVQNVTVQFTNTGLTPWKKGDVKLAMYDLGDAQSRFYSPSWPSKDGRIDFKETVVKTNETATFTFALKSPSTPGLYLNTYRLAGKQNIAQTDTTTVTKIYPTVQAQFVSSTIPVAMANVWRPRVTVKFKNVGLTAWNSGTVLKVYDLGNTQSPFKDSTWLNGFTVAKLKEKSVKRGETGTFEFYFKAPSAPGTYLNRFALFAGAKEVDGGGYAPLTRVDPYRRPGT